MDTLLKDGDQVADSRGLLRTVTGLEELAQRAMLRLTIRRGSLPDCPTLGSRLYALPKSAALPEEAVAAVREALLPMPEVWAEDIRAQYNPEQDRLCIAFILRVGEEQLPLTVQV